MPETGTPTLEELAIAINNEASAAMLAAAEGRFADACDRLLIAASYANRAYEAELAASLEP